MSARLVAIFMAACLLPGCGENAPPQEKSAAAATAAPPVVASAPVPADGQQLFDRWCLPCHAAGPGHPGTNRLAERLGVENSVLLDRENLNEIYVQTVVRNGFQMMPPFRPTELSDQEVAAVAVYVATGGGRRTAQGEKL